MERTPAGPQAAPYLRRYLSTRLITISKCNFRFRKHGEAPSVSIPLRLANIKLADHGVWAHMIPSVDRQTEPRMGFCAEFLFEDAAVPIIVPVLSN
jgi:hypothetical protein